MNNRLSTEQKKILKWLIGGLETYSCMYDEECVDNYGISKEEMSKTLDAFCEIENKENLEKFISNLPDDFIIDILERLDHYVELTYDEVEPQRAVGTISSIYSIVKVIKKAKSNMDFNKLNLWYIKV